MAFEVPKAWNREIVGNNIIWTANVEARCYHCGKTIRIKAIVNEGEYNEELKQEVENNGVKTSVYPTLAPPPNAEMELIFPEEGWSMLCHLTRNFFPFETCQAIRMGCEPYAAFLHWYSKVGTQFGEWVCPNEECFIETARSLRKEFNAIQEKVAALAGNG